MVRRSPGKARTRSREPKDIGLQVKGEEISFVATLPSSAGAFTRHGLGGGKITLDFAEDQLPFVIPAMSLIQTQIDVTLRPRLGAMPSGDDGERRRNRRRDGEEPPGELGLVGSAE